MSHAKDAEGENWSPRIRITVVIANRYAFDAEVVTVGRSRRRPMSRQASLSTAARAAGTS